MKTTKRKETLINHAYHLLSAKDNMAGSPIILTNHSTELKTVLVDYMSLHPEDLSMCIEEMMPRCTKERNKNEEKVS